LPRIAAAIFSRRSGLPCVGAAASLALSSTGESRSLFRAVVPSVMTPTSRALRQIVTVCAVTPHQYATASDDSRFTASARSSYNTSDRALPLGSVCPMGHDSAGALDHVAVGEGRRDVAAQESRGGGHGGARTNRG